mgnify:CR=1 FL=1
MYQLFRQGKHKLAPWGNRVIVCRCSVTYIYIASWGCRVKGPSDTNLGPVTRCPQRAGIKQLNRMWLHAMALVGLRPVLANPVWMVYTFVSWKTT